MHMYIILLVILIILTLVSFYANKKDITSPSFVSCVAYILCTICAMLGLFSWNNVTISWNLIGIVVFGLLSFIIGEIIVRKIYAKNKKNGAQINYDIIKIEKWKIVFSILVIIIEIVLMFCEIRRIAVAAGFDKNNNILNMFSFYRKKSQLFSTELVNNGLKINLIVSQINKLCNVLGIVYIYVFLKNIINKDKIKNNIIYVVPVLLSCILALMSGSRTQIIKYIVATFMIGFILYGQKNSFRKLFKRLVTISSCLIIIILPLFYITLPLLGREQDKDFFTYITFYLGTSIPSFENYLNNPPPKGEIFGEESLRGVNSFLNKIGIIDKNTPVSREWTNFPGRNHSNVYTAFRRYMQDFGITGVIICQFLFGVTFSFFYLLAKNDRKGIWLIFYGLYSYILIDQVRDELFFTTFVHINLFINIVLIFFVYFGIVKFEIKDIPIYKDKLKKLFKIERKKNAN